MHFTDGSTLSADDFPKIKKEMDKIIKLDLPIVREVVSREEARRRIEEIEEPFKIEILDSIKTEPITIYKNGDSGWWDLCAGPHCASTGLIHKKAFMLSSVAGAYWRGDDTREQLVRLYATIWETPEQLKAYKKKVEEAKKRDHRLLGQKLDLFTIQQQVGGGLVLWTPKGSKVRTAMEDYWRAEHTNAGYDIGEFGQEEAPRKRCCKRALAQTFRARAFHCAQHDTQCTPDSPPRPTLPSLHAPRGERGPVED